MIFQVTLYEGNWNKLPSTQIVQRLLKKRYYCSTNDINSWTRPSEVTFQCTDSDVLYLAEFSLRILDDMDYELVIDELYSRFYGLGPEYESMVEVTLIREA